MDNKEKYRQLCKKETSIPIFSRDWWLDATAGEDNWDVVLVEKGGEIFASMPYMVTKRYIFTYMCQPILTQKLGPWIKYPPGQKYDRKLGYENEILKNLIEKLPKADIFLLVLITVLLIGCHFIGKVLRKLHCIHMLLRI